LDISQGDARIEGFGDECMAERVRPDGLADPGAASEAADDPAGAVPVQPPPSGVRKIGPLGRSPMARSIAQAVRGTSGMMTILPPLRVMVSVLASSPRSWRDLVTGTGRGPSGPAS
jgi:hypothetical protein